MIINFRVFDNVNNVYLRIKLRLGYAVREIMQCERIFCLF